MKNNLEKFAFFCLYAIAFTPLIFGGRFFFPFVITKTLYFRIFLQLAGLAYLFLLTQNYKKYKPKMNTFLILMAVWVLGLFVSSWQGFNFYKSFWGSFERMEGFVFYIYLFFYVYLLFQFFKTKNDWHKYIKISLAVSFLVSIYSVIQKFSLLEVFEAGIDRVTGTLGNSAFLAGYLLLSIILGVYYFFQEKEKYLKRAILTGTILNLVALFLTSTRGSILGLLGGILFFLLINAIFSKGKIQVLSSIFLVLAVASVGIFYLQKDSLKQSDAQFLRRLANTSFEDATVKNRLLAWESGFKGWQEKPILGWGIEGYGAVYNKYYTPKLSEEWFDRSHNAYLDQAVNGGLIAFILYLTLLVWGFINLFKLKKENYWLFSFFSAGLFAYSIHLFFVFDVLSTSLFYFFILAFLSFLNQKKEDEEEREKVGDIKKFQGLIKFTAIFGSFILFYYLVFLPFKINRNIAQGYYYTIARPEFSYNQYSQALKHKYGTMEVARQLSDSFEALVNEDTDGELKNKYFQLSKESLKKSIKLYPFDLRSYFNLAEIGAIYGSTSEEKEELKDILKKSISLSEQRPHGYYLLANIYIKEGNNEKAKEILEKLINEMPWFGESRLRFAQAFYSVYPEESEKYFREGLDLFYSKNEDNLKIIITYLIEKENFGELIDYYKELIKLAPENYDYRIDLSKVYYNLEEKEKAIEQINIVYKKNPTAINESNEYINFIKQEMPGVLDF